MLLLSCLSSWSVRLKNGWLVARAEADVALPGTSDEGSIPNSSSEGRCRSLGALDGRAAHTSSPVEASLCFVTAGNGKR